MRTQAHMDVIHCSFRLPASDAIRYSLAKISLSLCRRFLVEVSRATDHLRRIEYCHLGKLVSILFSVLAIVHISCLDLHYHGYSSTAFTLRALHRIHRRSTSTSTLSPYSLYPLSRRCPRHITIYVSDPSATIFLTRIWSA